MLHAVSAKRSSVASDALDWTTSASYAQIRDYDKLVRPFGHRRFQRSQATAKANRKAPQQPRTPKRKRVMCACQDGHPASAGDCSGVPSLWIDSKARAVPYGRYVALRFSDSVTRWPLPRVIQGTAGLCRRSPVEDPLAADYSNRVPVALPQPEKTRFPSASKNWIVALYSKLLALVRWTLAVTTPDPAKAPFSS